MAHDPRVITNALLDIADARGIPITNMSLNKHLYFLHSDHLLETRRSYISLTFEAWDFGPVLPIIYRQFKCFGAKPITSRATKISSETGEDEVCEYTDAGLDLSRINLHLDQYGRMSASALMNLSHARGGPWYHVWHNQNQRHIGMEIPNHLILSYCSKQRNVKSSNVN